MSETIELDYPVTVDGREVKKIEMRRPKVKDMRGASKGGGSDEDQEVRLFAALTGFNPEDLGELDLSDYQKLQKAFSDFLS